jgi:hypothetical protein
MVGCDFEVCLSAGQGVRIGGGVDCGSGFCLVFWLFSKRGCLSY